MYEVKIIREVKGKDYDTLYFYFNEREEAIEFTNHILLISKYKIEIKYYKEVYDK